MAEESSFTDLTERLRAGDPGAAEAIFRRFAHRLIGLARSRLDVRIRQKVDPEDVMQSALKSFFLRHAEGQFDLDGWDSMWRVLVVITLRKCGHRVEHFTTKGRNVLREVSADADSFSSWEAVAREPTPEQAALLAEAVAEVMGALSDDRERRILELALQGFSAQEISEEVGRCERTVQRVLRRVRERLERSRQE